ncbi:MAG: AAA family ATPase [Chloroflexi bacterium]|nr:AAA family ATPase [Chloroflexota bacterium]
MAIKRIRVSNFKSFDHVDVELGNFNVLIGANASGKSAFVQIFKFLRDAVEVGLDNAISMQGGAEYLRNMRIGRSRTLSLEVVFDHDFEFLSNILGGSGRRSNISIRGYEISQEFALEFRARGDEFRIVEDVLRLKCEFFEKSAKKGAKSSWEGGLGRGEIIVTNTAGRVKVEFDSPPGVQLGEEDIVPSVFQHYLRDRKVGQNTFLLANPLLFAIIPSASPLYAGPLTDTSVYDFDPKLPKKAVPVSGKKELDEDGSNLAIVLKNITRFKENKRKFTNLMKNVLPFFDDIDTEKFADKSLFFKFREVYTGPSYLPASLLSDGTINITALITCLFFEDKKLIVIEEPERNIHPFLISRVVEMLREASEHKQIIVTTHNPEVVKHAGLEHLLLVSRDKDGFSTVCRPSEKSELQVFLKNDLGIDRLFVEDLLGV